MSRHRTSEQERDRYDTMLAEDAYRKEQDKPHHPRPERQRRCAGCGCPTRFDLCRRCDAEAYTGRAS